MKNIKFMILAAIPFMIAGCNNPNTSSTSTSSSDTTTEIPSDPKLSLGTGVIFAEDNGFNTKEASVIVENDKQYIVYSTNEEKNIDETVFALRVGEKNSDGKYEYSDKKIIFKANKEGWDKYIANPSIVKGLFKLDGEEYNYLLAYNGRSLDSANRRNSIGLAVAKTLDSEWKRVGDKPFIKHDLDIDGDQSGYTSPSMVNINKGGLIYLSYTKGVIDLTCTAFITVDLSDLNNVSNRSGEIQLTVKGLVDDGDETIFANADFALDKNGTLYTIRDVFPLSGVKPNAASKVELSYTTDAHLTLEGSWNHIDTLDGDKTIDFEDENSLGWDQIHSAALVKDSYGYLNDVNDIEIIYSTYNDESNDENYYFSSQLCSYVFKNTGL